EDRQTDDGDHLPERLEARLAAEHDQAARYGALGDGPEHALPSRATVWFARAEHVDDERRRVRGRSEEEGNDHDGDALHQRGQRELFEVLEQRQRYVR